MRPTYRRRTGRPCVTSQTSLAWRRLRRGDSGAPGTAPRASPASPHTPSATGGWGRSRPERRLREEPHKVDMGPEETGFFLVSAYLSPPVDCSGLCPQVSQRG